MAIQTIEEPLLGKNWPLSERDDPVVDDRTEHRSYRVNGRSIPGWQIPNLTRADVLSAQTLAEYGEATPATEAIRSPEQDLGTFAVMETESLPETPPEAADAYEDFQIAS